MAKHALRMTFTDTLLKLAKQDSTLFAVASDSRGSVTLTDFAEQLPGQFVECGIAEQDAIGISAGLANGGLRPFVCGPACFYTLRSAEQVKVDIGYSHQNVKVIGVSGGISYGALGATHHSTHDIALLRAIPNIEIYLPSDGHQMIALTRYLAATDTPAYVRVGRAAVEDVYESPDAAFTPGKANHLRTGGDVSILACGEMVYHALQAADLLKARGITAGVWDMVSLRPLDEAAVLQAAEAPLVVTVEEHSVNGGLGAAAAELLAQRKPTRMKILGLPDEDLYNGPSPDVFAHYGLTGAGIADTVEKAL